MTTTENNPAQERLRTARTVWLCAARAEGPPLVRATWFVFLEGVWWIGAAAGGTLVRLLEHRPRATLALDGPEPLVAEGDARLRRTGFPARVRESFLAKYGWDPAIPARPGERRVLLEIAVRDWVPASLAE
ncbi:pyridoxamine 5'-phosphate oxidase family protein [Streptomyces sp. NPDC058426]|uniref:pyridoxamine 5'-phosphate oxidase family protein n=1 Tax=Streptomyces sp. NPDC058426 TaxID=3346493 RepID=UPI0036624124